MWKKMSLGLILSANLGLTALPAHALQRGGIVTITSMGEPEVLNPIFDHSDASRELYNLIFSGLITMDDHGDLVPDLLVYIPTFDNGGVQVTENGEMVVTYKLREHLRWHDGELLTSEDIQFTWQANSDPKVIYPPNPGYEQIRYVEVVDDQTAKVYFYRTYADYTKLFRYVLPKHAFLSRHWPLQQNHPYNMHPYGSGPFILKEWKKGSHALLDANPRYHLAKPYLDQIRYKFQPNDFRNLPQVVNWLGSTDIVQRLSIAAYDLLKNREDIDIKVISTYDIDYLGFNLAHPLVADLRLRRALAHAIDRSEISLLFYGLARSAYSDQHRESWKYNPTTEGYYPYNPEFSKRLLDEAGWKLSKDQKLRSKSGKPLTLTLTISQNSRSHQLVGDYLKKAFLGIGVDLKIVMVPASVWHDFTLQDRKYELTLATWDSSPDADIFARWHSTQIPPTGRNYTQLKDYRVDELLKEIQINTALEQQKKAYHRLGEVLLEQLPAMPLYYNPVLEIHKRTLQNLRPNVHQGLTWNSREWWIE